MKKIIIIVAVALIGVGILGCTAKTQIETKEQNSILINSGEIKLPNPSYKGKISIEETLQKRRSVREYKSEALSIEEISQLLWAAQGITDEENNFRTAPSAGALYPLEIYIISSNINGLDKGVYKYIPQEHKIIQLSGEDKKNEIYNVAMRQSAINEASALIIFSAVYERTIQKYGDQTEKYVHIEVGHAAQNVCLQSVSLNLGTVVIGAFEDGALKTILNLPENENPLYIIPVGKI